MCIVYICGIRRSPSVCMCTFIAHERVFYKSDQHGQIRTSGHAVIRVHLGGLSLCWKGSAAESEPRINMQQAQLCVWVWKRVATSRVPVPGHTVWMKVIASGGWPAAETPCASVWMHMKFRAAAVLSLLHLLTCMYIYVLGGFFLHFLLRSFLLCFSRNAVLVNM